MAVRELRYGKTTDRELDPYIVQVKLTGFHISDGAWGSVEEGEMSGVKVAVKKLHSALTTLGSREQVERWISDFMSECKLLSKLRHPNIVQFLGVSYIPDSNYPVLVMEKLETSLDDLLESAMKLSLDVKVHLLLGTIKGLVYLHCQNPRIVHCDLSAKNVLIDTGLAAKIADLGVAKMIQHNIKDLKMTPNPGAILYMPPEITQEHIKITYDTAIDVFSFGVLCLFTLTQTFPKDLKPEQYYEPSIGKQVGRSEIERREEYITMLTTSLDKTHLLVRMTLKCLEFNPKDRPATQLVQQQLEEVNATLPKICTKTKLQLIVEKKCLTNSVSAIQQKLSVKEAQLNEARMSISKTEQEFIQKQNLLMKELSDRESQQRLVQQEFIANEVRLQSQTSVLEVSLEQATAEINQKEIKLREITRREQNLTSIATEFAEMIDGLQKDLLFKENEISCQKSLVHEQQAVINQLQEDVKTREHDVKEKSCTTLNMESLISCLQSQIHTLQTDLVCKEDQLTSKATQMCAQTTQIHQLQTDIRSIEDIGLERQSKVMNIEAQLSHLRSMFHQRSTDIGNRIANLERESQNAYSIVEQQLKDVTESSYKEKKMLQEELGNLHEQIFDSSLEITKLKSFLMEKNFQMSSIEDNSKAEKKKFKERIAEKKLEIDELNHQIVQQKETNLQLVAHIREEGEELRKRNEIKQQELQGLIDHLQSDADKLKENVEQLKRSINEKQIEINTLFASLSKSQRLYQEQLLIAEKAYTDRQTIETQSRVEIQELSLQHSQCTKLISELKAEVYKLKCSNNEQILAAQKVAEDDQFFREKSAKRISEQGSCILQKEALIHKLQSENNELKAILQYERNERHQELTAMKREFEKQQQHFLETKEKEVNGLRMLVNKYRVQNQDQWKHQLQSMKDELKMIASVDESSPITGESEGRTTSIFSAHCQEMEGHEFDSLPMDKEESAASHPQDRTVSERAKIFLSSPVALDWKRSKNIPKDIYLYGQPIPYKLSLLIRGETGCTESVYKYFAGKCQWEKLPSPPVYRFSLAVFENSVVIVGGRSNSGNNAISNTIFSWDDSSRKWIQRYPNMPESLIHPFVVANDVWLIVIGSNKQANSSESQNVIVLDITNKHEWMTCIPLPLRDTLKGVLIDDFVYVIGQKTKTVLRAQIPGILSSASWEQLSSVPLFYSSPITFEKTLLVVGGSKCSDPLQSNSAANIFMYNPKSNQWLNFGDLPSPVSDCHCAVLCSEIVILGGEKVHSKSVYLSQFSSCKEEEA